MDNRKALLNKIASSISFYAETIRSNVESGRTDILIDAEEICCALLNRTFGFELKLLNQARRNFPAIDMADEQHRVAVQVTSSNTRAKVQNTLNSFLEHRLNDQYATLLVFILVAVPKFRQRVDFSVPDGMELKIMTFLDLIRELETVERERLEEVAKYLEETIGTDTASSSADAVTTTVSADVIKGLTEDARQVFNFAGFLSEAGLERNVFEYGLEPLQRKALPNLLEQGVLYQKDTIIRLHPDTRNLAQAQAVQNHVLFLDRLWDYEKSWHWDRVSLTREIALQRSLAQVYALAAELFSERAVVYTLRSAELYRNTQQYMQALRQEQKALQVMESVKKDPWGTARAHHFSGECYAALQEYASALKEWEKTLFLCKGTLHVSNLDLSEAHHNVGRALTALEEYEDAEHELLNALKLLEEFRKTCSDFAPQPWMKEIYDSLATVYTKLDLTTLAAQCSKNALRIPNEQDELWIHLSQNHRKRFSAVPLLNLPLASAMQEEAFVGRQEELRRINEKLEQEGVVFLSGLGGMGKTELALRYGQDYRDAGRGMVHFVRFTGSFRQTVVEIIAPNIPNFSRLGLDEEQIYAKAMQVLQKCDGDDLLIVDNVDKVDHFEVLMQEPTFRVLRTLPMKLIITTRMQVRGGIELKPLANYELYQIFNRYGLDLSTSQMDDLIAAVDAHTMTVDLIARTLSESWEVFTPQDILSAMTSRILQTGDYPLIDNDHNPEQQSFYAHLRTLFNLNYISDDGKYALRCASLLPPGGMDPTLFVRALPKGPANAIRLLEKQGWVHRGNHLLSIHPVVRLVCETELEPTDESCREFLDKVWEQYGTNQYDQGKTTQIAELFSRAADILEDRFGEWTNRAGYIYSNLGDYVRALEYLQKALAIQEQALSHDHPSLAATYENVGYTYGDLGDNAKALEFQQKALAIREKVLSPEHPGLATSYNNVGYTYGDLGNHERALEYHLKALVIREKVLPLTHPSIAQSCHNIAWAYRDMGDYQSALKYMRRAVDIAEQSLPEGHPERVKYRTDLENLERDIRQ